jgi:hypothetical protein
VAASDGRAAKKARWRARSLVLKRFAAALGVSLTNAVGIRLTVAV